MNIPSQKNRRVATWETDVELSNQQCEDLENSNSIMRNTQRRHCVRVFSETTERRTLLDTQYINLLCFGIRYALYYLRFYKHRYHPLDNNSPESRRYTTIGIDQLPRKKRSRSRPFVFENRCVVKHRESSSSLGFITERASNIDLRLSSLALPPCLIVRYYSTYLDLFRDSCFARSRTVVAET